MKEIEPSEIDDQVVHDMAVFFVTGGQQGTLPEWHKMFVLARKCSAPVWEIEASLSDDRTFTPRRTWITRALMLEFAEAEAAQMQNEAAQHRRAIKENMRIVNPFEIG